MKKTISYRLFKLGAIPAKVRPILEGEELVVFDEGMPGRMILRRVTGPGRRHHYRFEGFSGWLAVTGKRVVCYTYRKRQINIAVDDPQISKLEISMPSEETLSITFESSDFRKGWQGAIEFRFKTPKAAQFHDTLKRICA